MVSVAAFQLTLSPEDPTGTATGDPGAAGAVGSKLIVLVALPELENVSFPA